MNNMFGNALIYFYYIYIHQYITICNKTMIVNTQALIDYIHFQ